jgi:biopolymer transport protein ExbD
MALRQPATDDSVLNMTPMIDIVFQLILFFLFNLRIKALDHRLDALLPPVGEQRTLEIKPPYPSIEVALKRRGPPEEARTRIEVAGSAWDLPRGRRTGTDAEDEGLEAARAVVRGALRDRIAFLREHEPLPGEIKVPVTPGGPVPHGDVMLVLDAFVEAGVTDVTFEGARRPRR